MKLMQMDESFLSRGVNEGFSGGEKKRNEILQMAVLEPKLAEAIIDAAQEVIDGKLDDHFPLVVWQTGSGTQSNMNANEVISNRAIEMLGGTMGSKAPVHPNDHVNMAQSTNDVIPTAIRLGALDLLEPLLSAFRGLRDAFAAKGKEFDDVLKSGRTHLQDAMPIRLGQEFTAYAGSLDPGIRRVREAADYLRDLGIGGSATNDGGAGLGPLDGAQLGGGDGDVLLEDDVVEGVVFDGHGQAHDVGDVLALELGDLAARDLLDGGDFARGRLLRLRYDLFDEGTQGLGLGQCGLDATMGDESNGEVGQHCFAMLAGDAEGGVVFIVTHCGFWLSAPDRQSGRSVGRQRTAREPKL